MFKRRKIQSHELDSSILKYYTLRKLKNKTKTRFFMAKRKTLEERLKEYERQYRELARKLAQTGYLWKGSIVRQMLTCGKESCACHHDESRRHGPYAYWTTKVQGRTVSRLLPPAEADLYEEWIRNRRALEKIERQMVALSKKVAPLILRKRESAQQAERGNQ